MPLLLLKGLKFTPYVLLFFAGFYVNGQIAQNRLTQKLAEQQQQFNQLLIDRQNLERKHSDEYQKKLSALRADGSKYKRMYANQCVTVSKAASRPDGTGSTGELSGTYAVDAGELMQFAGDAEAVRLQLEALQGFINGQ